MSHNHAIQTDNNDDYTYRRLMQEHRDLDEKIEYMRHIPSTDTNELKHLKIMKLRLADQMEYRLKELEN